MLSKTLKVNGTLLDKSLITLSGKLSVAQQSAEKIAESYLHIRLGFDEGKITLPIAQRLVLALEVRSAELVQFIIAAGHSYADMVEVLAGYDKNAKENLQD